jgi:hypothetical protein
MKHSDVQHFLSKNKYPIFLFSVVFILFSGIIFDFFLREKTAALINLIIITVAGFNLLEQEKSRHLLYRIITVLLLIVMIYGARVFGEETGSKLIFLILFLFFIFISFTIYRQLYLTREITPRIIMGAFSGYVLLGWLGSFVFAAINIYDPQAFSQPLNYWIDFDKIVYFSFISLTTIGYGDIYPVNEYAQRISVVLGLTGQFYLAVIIGVLIGKYLSKTTR